MTSDVAFSITVLEPSFCSISFADTPQDTKIYFVLCHVGAYHQVKRFDDSLQKKSVRKRHHAFHNAVQLRQVSK